MACEITINDPIGTRTPFGVAVSVTGTASEATYVLVQVDCTRHRERMVSVDELSGRWQATLGDDPDVILGCTCGARVRITVTSSTDPTCTAVYDGLLRCDACVEIRDIGFEYSNCLGADRLEADVNFSAVLSDPTAAANCTFTWWFGDGVVDRGAGLTTAHHYRTPGRYSVTVVAECPGCPIEQFSLVLFIPPCCAPIDLLTATVEGCQTTFVASTTPPNALGMFDWTFGDGSTATSRAPAVVHTYSRSGMYEAKVTFTPDGGTCKSTTQRTTVSIAGCGGASPDHHAESGGCLTVRLIQAISLVLAALAGIVTICMPAAATWLLTFAAVFAGLAVVLAVVLWALECPKPCGWKSLLAWEVTLGVAYGLLFFGLCCPRLYYVAVGLFATAAAFFYRWRQQCTPTTCQVVTEIAVLLTGVVLPVIGWLKVIPGLQACASIWLEATLGTAVTGLVVWMAKCKSA